MSPSAELRDLSRSIHVSPWDDPVVDALGHDARSPYVERFWLATLGPSTTFLARHLASRFEATPDGFDLDLEDTARRLGLGLRGGATSPFLRSLGRLAQFRLSRAVGQDAIEVRRRVPPLTRSQVQRLSPPLRDEHDTWQREANDGPTVEQRRTRSRRLALSLLELGEADEEIELQLHRWKIHPAMAHEALRWAHSRRGSILADKSTTPTATAAAGPDHTPGPIAPPRPTRLPPRTGPRPGAVFDPFDPPLDAA